MTDFIGSGTVVYVGLSSGGYPNPRKFKFIDSKNAISNQESSEYSTIVWANQGVIHIRPDNASLQYSPVIFEWGAVSGAYEYQLQIATDSEFNNIVRDIILLEPLFVLETEIQGTLYWRARYRN